MSLYVYEKEEKRNDEWEKYLPLPLVVNFGNEVSLGPCPQSSVLILAKPRGVTPKSASAVARTSPAKEPSARC